MSRILSFVFSLIVIGAVLTGCGEAAPEAKISSPTNNATLNSKAVAFQATATGQNLTYTWDFGDNTAKIEKGGASVTHTYDKAGKYTAKVKAVTASNKEGKEATVIITVNNANPVAQFTSNPTSGVAPLAVAFDGSASSDPDGQIGNYQWDFGDNTVGSSAKVNHTYDAAGTFNVTLTVTDNDNGKATKSQAITVTAPEPTGEVYEVRMMAMEDGRFMFEPAVLKVEPGDTVRWINVNQAHTSTTYSSLNGKVQGAPEGGPSWDSGVLVTEGQTWEYTIPLDATAGSYPYFCMPHESFGQVGILVVGSFSEPSADFLASLSGMTLENMNALIEQARGL